MTVKKRLTRQEYRTANSQRDLSGDKFSWRYANVVVQANTKSEARARLKEKLIGHYINPNAIIEKLP